MPRRKAPGQVSDFSGGLITEFNPLEGNPQTSSDELNMTIRRDNSRAKRLGFDYESGFSAVNSTITAQADQYLASSIFKWENAGGNSQKSLLVTQVGNSIHIFDLDSDPVSSDKIYTQTYDVSTYSQKYSFDSIDGRLVVCNGEKEVYVYTYDEDTETVSEDTVTLYIRDLFGLQAFDGSDDLTLSSNLTLRPSTLSDEHLYNLRNQGFKFPQIDENTETLGDPIAEFQGDTKNTSGVYPSNADNLNEFLYADPNDSGNRIIERYFAGNHVETKPGNSPAPLGHFIIDALERGASRVAEEQSLRDRNSQLTLSVSSLGTDTTPGGATVLSQFSGRIWYAGFSGKTTGGDTKSPRMSSYILFTNLIKDITDFGKCYQIADPTSHIDPAIVDTDGGFIRIDKAYGINRLQQVSDSLFVFAENGVWRITGAEDGQFAATAYQTTKLTDVGCVSGDSVVVFETSVFFWSRDGIYLISQDEFGVWRTQDITQPTIKTFFLNISEERKRASNGYFDSYNKSVHWVYNLEDTSETENNELVLYVERGAFAPFSVNTISGGFPKILAVSESNPYSAVGTNFDVFDDTGTTITNDALEDIFITVPYRSGTLKEIIYLVIIGTSPTITFSFGSYRDTTLYDWVSTTQTDYDAYLVSSPMSVNEGKSRKQLPYVYCFFERTENGFDAQYNPQNVSSCLLSARFSWHDTSSGNKWTTPRQAYRYRRSYIPVNDSDGLDTGESVIWTKNRIRGSGNAISLRFEAEAGKNLVLHGWSFYVETGTDD